MRARAVTPVYGGDSVALQRDRAPLLLVKSKCRESYGRVGRIVFVKISKQRIEKYSAFCNYLCFSVLQGLTWLVRARPLDGRSLEEGWVDRKGHCLEMMPMTHF